MIKSTPSLELQNWPLDRLIFYARNPRKNDSAVDRMCASLREFGFKIPVLARGDGEVVDGHLRLKAARKLGIAEIPVILCDEWTEAQVRAFRLLVNRSLGRIGTMSCFRGSAGAPGDGLRSRAHRFRSPGAGRPAGLPDRRRSGERRAAGRGKPGEPSRRSVAVRRAPDPLRGFDRPPGGRAAAGRAQADSDGDRSSLRY